MSIREVATVKWFNTKKGFGFLVDSGGSDVFVHYRNIEPGEGGFKDLQEGEQVEFLPVQTDKGWSAAEVKRAAPAIS